MSTKLYIDIKKIHKIVNLLNLSLSIDDADIVELVIESVIETLQEEINLHESKPNV